MYIHKTVSMVQWRLAKSSRYELHPIWPTHRPYVNNLNHIIKDFIAGGYDFWLNIDADNPPIRNPLDLIELDKDIIGLPTPVWHYKGTEPNGERPIYWTGYDYIPQEDAYKEHNPKEGLQKVDSIGTGCFLFARRIFDNPQMKYARFARTYTREGLVSHGNEHSFFRQAQKAGLQIFAHYDYPCNHHKELPLSEVIAGFRNLYEK